MGARGSGYSGGSQEWESEMRGGCEGETLTLYSGILDPYVSF